MKVAMTDWLEPSTLRHPNPVTGPWEITLTWREQNGRAVCSGVSLAAMPGNDVEINASVWRSIPLASLVKDARRTRFEANGGALLEGLDPDDAPLDRSWFEHFAHTAGKWEARPGRPTELDADHYRQVAETYTLAYADNGAPLPAICKRWTCSRPTASRWVARARELGFLPETRRGRARGNADLIASGQEQGDSK